VQSGTEVKVAISATDGSLESDVDPRFGRARFFVVVDGEGGLVRVIDNRGSDELPHGAGTAAVEAMVRSGVTTVLTGQVGPRAEQGLRAAGIDVRTGVSGVCRDALKVYLAGARA
jgi:predicted Fe-Mo cluster-binding NifX family protein